MSNHNKNPRYYGNNKVNPSNKKPKTFQEKINAREQARREPYANQNKQRNTTQRNGTSGIYKITNDRTGETYIGQSKNIEKRIKSHENELRQGTHHNRGLQSDWSGGDTFTYKILEETSSDRQTLNQKEEKYISQYNSFNQGYNQTPGGQYDKYKGYYGHGGGRLGSSYQQRNSYNNNSYNKNSHSNNRYYGKVHASFIEYMIFGILYIIFTAVLFTFYLLLFYSGTFESVIWGVIISIFITTPIAIKIFSSL